MMKSQQAFVAAAALAAGLAALPGTTGPVRAEAQPAQIDRGFNPDTGQINPGTVPAVPSESQARPIPAQEEARAALMMPDMGEVSLGDNPADRQGNAAATATQPDRSTSGMANVDSAPSGPIGATLQTMPAKFSKRNDTLDRVPIMAWPLRLDAGQRRQIYQAVMADATQPAAGGDALAPANSLSAEQAANAMHPLPAGARDIPGVRNLSYVKGENKVLLVLPETRTVVDQITAS